TYACHTEPQGSMQWTPGGKKGCMCPTRGQRFRGQTESSGARHCGPDCGGVHSHAEHRRGQLSIKRICHIYMVYMHHGSHGSVRFQSA
ncbi:hypothetical protein M9458_027128, partial [Cirrhinus mrigala]